MLGQHLSTRNPNFLQCHLHCSSFLIRIPLLGVYLCCMNISLLVLFTWYYNIHNTNVVESLRNCWETFFFVSLSLTRSALCSRSFDNKETLFHCCNFLHSWSESYSKERGWKLVSASFHIIVCRAK